MTHLLGLAMAREKPLPCLSPFAVNWEANTKPIGLSPLPTTPLYKRGNTLGDLHLSIYRVSTETLLYRSVRTLEGSEARAPPAGCHRCRPESHRHRGDTPALHQLASSTSPRPHRLRQARWTALSLPVRSILIYSALV
jgi:hypothetical protein